MHFVENERLNRGTWMMREAQKFYCSVSFEAEVVAAAPQILSLDAGLTYRFTAPFNRGSLHMPRLIAMPRFIMIIC